MGRTTMKYREMIQIENLASYYSERIDLLTDLCHGLSKEAGWWEGFDPKDPLVITNKLCLIHSEVSEAMEGYRKDLMDDHLPSRKMAEVELADAMIRILDLAGASGFDLGGAMVEKLVYNIKRKDHQSESREQEDGKKF